MTLIEHLSELRSRLLKSLVALAVCTLLCWGFIDSSGQQFILYAPC